MSHDLRTNLSQNRVTLWKLSGSYLTWGILGGGFLLGMLFGGFFLFGQSGPPAETAQGSYRENSAPAQELSPKANTATAENSDDLAAERERLRQELEAEKLRREVESLRRELVDLKTSPVSTESTLREPANLPRGRRNRNDPSSTRSPAPPAANASGPSPGEATLTYWNQVNAIILQEAALRAAPAGGVTAANATGFLDARIQAAEFAVDALRQLDTVGVDAKAVDLCEQLIRWFAQGGEVAQTGRQLLTRASVQERQGSAGKMYQAAEHSHAKAVNAINSTGEQVRQAMSRKYNLSFPPLN